MKNGQNNNKQALTMMIFGATGDLAHRKLLPALYHLIAQKQLPEETTVVAIGRRKLSDEDYRQQARDSIAEFSRTGVDQEQIDGFLSKLVYHPMEFIKEPDSYQPFREHLEQIEGNYTQPPIRLFFLAVAPEFFGVIVKHLAQQRLVERNNPNHRVMIEKPFGSALERAPCALATACLSRCGTTTTSTTSRSPPLKPWGWKAAAPIMSRRAF